MRRDGGHPAMEFTRAGPPGTPGLYLRHNAPPFKPARSSHRSFGLNRYLE